MALYLGGVQIAAGGEIQSLSSETWTFTLESGETVDKVVCLSAT